MTDSYLDDAREFARIATRETRIRVFITLVMFGLSVWWSGDRGTLSIVTSAAAIACAYVGGYWARTMMGARSVVGQMERGDRQYEVYRENM